jgi:hypothetical protein
MPDHTEHDFLRSLIRTVKPEHVAASGVSAEGIAAVGEAQKANGVGTVVDVQPGATPRGTIDMLLCGGPQPEAEIRRLLPQVSPHGLILLHDPETAKRLAKDGLLSAVQMPAPAGLVIAQKPAKT